MCRWSRWGRAWGAGGVGPPSRGPPCHYKPLIHPWLTCYLHCTFIRSFDPLTPHPAPLQWEAIPDIGDYTVKKQKLDKFTPVPDSLLAGAAVRRQGDRACGLERCGGWISRRSGCVRGKEVPPTCTLQRHVASLWSAALAQSKQHTALFFPLAGS